MVTFLVTLMFILSGFFKIKDFDSTVSGFMVKTGLDSNLAQPAIMLAACLQIIAPLIINYQTYKPKAPYRKWANYSAYALALFTILATLVYHFPPKGSTYYPFISNLTTFGALLMIAMQFEDTGPATQLQQLLL